ncbi:MAG: sigma-70 family RNA polymerase sigma factor [Jatrophihabitans sp.]
MDPSDDRSMLVALSDAHLLAAAQAGDRAAFGILWSRHEAAVRNYARQLAMPSDVDELVSESFYRVLRSIDNGAGPDGAFRAYLLTTLRRAHIDNGRRYYQRVTLTGDDSKLETEPAASAAEVAGERAEQGIAWQAWASLPEDSRTLLWHLIIEEQTPAQIAPILGTTPNGVSSRAVRARERLRQAYLQQQVRAADNTECAASRARLGEYVRGSISRRDRVKLDLHLATCALCRAAAAELGDLNRTLRLVIAPVILGGSLLSHSYLAAGKSGLAAGWLTAGHRLVAAKATLLAGTAAASLAITVLAVPQLVGPSHQRQIRGAGSAPIRPPLPAASEQPSPPVNSVSRAAGRPSRIPTRTVPSPIRLSSVPASAPASTSLATPTAPGSTPPVVAPGSSPTMSAAIQSGTAGPSATAQPSGTATISSVPPSPTASTSMTPANNSRSSPSVTRSIQLRLLVGNDDWLPGTLSVQVPPDWAVDSLTSPQSSSCSSDSKTSASCAITGPAWRSYYLTVTVTGPAAPSSPEWLVASYRGASGTVLMSRQFPLSN